ncbi:MAG: hypothetical protein IJ858_00945 [Acidaminococcaceae bacterium]|nr:hypothetical protein [Acidaminococcaceae bacterium]
MSSDNKVTNTNTNTNYNSLFLFVVDHLDSKGNYDGSPLPDNLMREYTYGAEDAAMFHPKTDESTMEEAKDIYLLLKEWLKNPTQKTKNNLYEKIYTTPLITVFFALAGQLRGEKLSYDLLHLAQEWFYTAKDREAVKFAYLICGLIGLDQVRKSFSEHLYNDLFTMARCEEFTIFLCMACQLSEIHPQKELWFLARHTQGWGKAVTLLLLEYRTPAQRLWLLKKGLELRIFWPPLAPVIIKESGLEQMLQEKEITEDIYLAAANVIITYMIFLVPNQDPAGNPFENSLMMPVRIALEPLLRDFLRHAETYGKTPKNLLTIFAIKDRLELMATEKAGTALSANAAQLLIGQCDALIYCKDWEPEIRASLFDNSGRLNSEIVDFAADLDIDIWPDVIKFYNDHPKDHTALRYLMFADAGGDEKRVDTRRHLFLDCAEAHLRQYMEEEDLLVNFAHYLKDYPGEGESLLQACLTSIYEHAIGMAALSVSTWPRDKVPVKLKKAVIQAMQLNQNPFIGLVLQSIIDERVAAPVDFDYGDL